MFLIYYFNKYIYWILFVLFSEILLGNKDEVGMGLEEQVSIFYRMMRNKLD